MLSSRSNVGVFLLSWWGAAHGGALPSSYFDLDRDTTWWRMPWRYFCSLAAGSRGGSCGQGTFDPPSATCTPARPTNASAAELVRPTDPTTARRGAARRVAAVEAQKSARQHGKLRSKAEAAAALRGVRGRSRQNEPANMHEGGSESQQLSCIPIATIMNAHTSSMQSRRNPRTLVAYFGKLAGIGDQVSNLLASYTIALASGRRFELAPEPTSYIRAAFDLPFDASYTGDASWVDEIDRWMESDFWPDHWLRVRDDRAGNITRIAELPRIVRSEFAHSAAVHMPSLAARLVVPSPTGTYPPHHTVTMNHAREFFMGGNTGTAVFSAFFGDILAANGVKLHDQHAACLLRLLLRPSQEVRELQDSMRPSHAADSPAAGNALRVGIHIRAAAHLINREGGHDATRHFTPGSDGAADQPMCAAGRDPSPPQHEPSHFGEYWQAARAAQEWAQRRSAGPSTNLEPQWFLVSDSSTLKKAAAAQWPGRVHTTAVQPTHILCKSGAPVTAGRSAVGANAGGIPEQRTMLQTVAELLLLAESDVLVIGRSRFAYAALLLSPRCRQTFHITIDRRRALRNRRCHTTPNGTWAMRCIGPEQKYSVRMLQDSNGDLISLAGKPWREARKLPLFLHSF